MARDASALLRFGRTVLRPSAFDRERVLVSLMAKLRDIDFVDDPRLGSAGEGFAVVWGRRGRACQWIL
jgi:hypothetical protein